MVDLFDAPIVWGADTHSVAAPATVPATAEDPRKPPQIEEVRPAVATVATVADWQDGLTRFALLDRPDFMSRDAWLMLQADAGSLGRTWASDLFHLGWTVQEVFGWHPKPWCSAVEPSGLVRFLNGRPISAVDGNSATIEQRMGAALTYRRHDPAMNIPWDRSGALPIWVAFHPENVSKCPL